jgi:zinc transport system permease protein
MQNALIAIIIITPLLAIIGTVIVNHKMAFFSDAIGHSSLTGVALGVLFGIGASNIIVAIFSAVLAIIITILKLKQNSNTDNIISVVSSIGVALGIVVLSQNGGFSNYTSYIIGDILSITKQEILAILVALVLTVIVMYFAYNKLTLISINSTLAKSRGINVAVYELIFSIVVAIIVALAIKWVGILVINSMIVIPCVTSRGIAKNISQYVIFSIIISMFCGIVGLILSYEFDVSTGATIVLINGIIYMLSRIGNFVKLK